MKSVQKPCKKTAVLKHLLWILPLLTLSIHSESFADDGQKLSAASVGQELKKTEDRVMQPEIIAPPEEDKGVSILPKPEGEMRIDPSLKGKQITITNTEVLGDIDWLAQTGMISTLIDDTEGKTLTYREIREVLGKCQRALINSGYYAVSLTLQPGPLADGRLVVYVDKGRIGTMSFHNRKTGDAFSGKYFSERQLRRNLPGVYENGAFYYKDLYLGIYRTNTSPDLKMDVDLHVRSDEEEEGDVRYVDMDFYIKERMPLHGAITVENSGNETIGEWRPSLTIQHLNLTKHDDVLTAYVGPFSTNTNTLKGGSGNYYYPHEIGNGGYFMGFAGYTDLDIKDAVPGIDVNGDGWFVGGQGAYKLIDDIKQNVTVSLGYVFRKVKDRMVLTAEGEETEFNSRNVALAPVSLGINYSNSSPDIWGGRNFIDSRTSINFAGVLGASDKEEIQLLRSGADADYLVHRVSIARLQPLFGIGQDGPGEWMLSAKVNGQIATGPLVSAEQMSLGGMSTVRGFPGSIVIGDNGVYGRFEVRTPLWAGCLLKPGKVGREEAIKDGKILDRLQLITFLDGGAVFIKDPVDEEDQYTLASIGAGFSLNLSRHMQLRVDYGIPLTDTDDLEELDENVDSKGYFHLRMEVAY